MTDGTTRIVYQGRYIKPFSYFWIHFFEIFRKFDRTTIVLKLTIVPQTLALLSHRGKEMKHCVKEGKFGKLARKYF